MSKTDDLLAELEDLENEVPVKIVEPQHVDVEVTMEVEAQTDDSDLDERSFKIIALTDLVVEEFDRAIGALTTVRNAVKALREELSPPSGDVLEEEDAEYPDGPNQPPVFTEATTPADLLKDGDPEP